MFAFLIYNPLSRPLSTHVRLPVTGNSYVVRSMNDGMYILKINKIKRHNYININYFYVSKIYRKMYKIDIYQHIMCITHT